MKIMTNVELADHIAGKRVLHLNSLGKDSLACLHWLDKWTHAKVVSLFFTRIGGHPDDGKYIEYLESKYRAVMFVSQPNPWELNDISVGVFQSPVKMLTEYAGWEHYGFDYEAQAEDLAKTFDCEFICIGHSRYESVARATNFYKSGLLQGNKIYPLGLLSKEQVLDIVKNSGTKIHPSYKFTKSSFDRPSYYKMRAAFLASPEFKRRMYAIYPLLALDEYRYERLFK